MYKLKTCKSAAKRIKIKKKIILRKKAFKSHLMSSKNSKRVRNLSKQVSVNYTDVSKFLRMNPYR